MLDVIDVGFAYQDEPLLRRVSFTLPAGGLLHLKGHNGAGKSTLLRLIAGLYQPHHGQIQWLSRSIHQNLAQYQRQLCFIGHKLALNPLLTIKENCIFDVHYHAQIKPVTELASLFKLDHSLNKLCSTLSAGQQRQVALLRLWMTTACLWLLDEPFVALDEWAFAVLIEKINHHRSKGGVVILTSHQALPLDVSNYQELVL